MNKDETQIIYVSHRLRFPEDHLTFNERNIPLSIHVKYLGSVFDKRITWRQHIQIIEIKPPKQLSESTPYSKVSQYQSRYSDWLQAGRPWGWCSSPCRIRNLPFSISSRPNLGPTQSSMKWALGALSPRGRLAEV
jgi:hypothetical protein